MIFLKIGSKYPEHIKFTYENKITGDYTAKWSAQFPHVPTLDLVAYGAIYYAWSCHMTHVHTLSIAYS